MSSASSSNSVSSTRQNVTLPEIPQLFNPNFLDILLPPSDEETYEIIPASDDDEDSTNTLMKVLQNTTYRTVTENGANAFSSTLSATLDAFTGLAPSVDGSRLKKLLSNAWKEDPLITLKIIFNLRSIHEGKGERLLFYRYAFSIYAALVLTFFVKCLRLATRSSSSDSHSESSCSCRSCV